MDERRFYEWLQQTLRLPVHDLPIDEKGFPLYPESVVQGATHYLKGDSLLCPTERLAIYHRQIWDRFDRQLRAVYPALMHLITHDRFHKEIVQPFLLHTWTHDPLLADLGRSLPAWLRGSYGQDNRPFVLGASLVDAAYQRLHFEPEVKVILEGDFFTWREHLLKGKEPALPILGDLELYCLGSTGWRKEEHPCRDQLIFSLF